jgi:assimilatory nitrate reductase catalytic subunit
VISLPIKGGLCRKGWTSAQLLQTPDRLTTPLLRDSSSGTLCPASWDDALDYITGQIRRIQRDHGDSAVGLFGGGGLTNEKAYLLGKFARVALKTCQIDYNGRFCMASAAVAGEKAFGIDRGLPFPLADLAEAEVIFISGANPADTMPPIMQYFDEQRRRQGRLIVSDSRRTATARVADLHLQLVPGTDAALANGLLHIVIRDGFIDPSFIDQRTTGFDQVRHTVGAYWPDRVERITGIPASQLEQAARWLGYRPRRQTQ